MTIEEAIKHAEEVAEEHTKYNIYGGFESCDECASDHRQLAEWLTDYKRLLEQEPKWIPVNKPPKEEGKYLVTMNYTTHDTIETAEYSKNLYKVNVYDFYNKKRAGWYKYDSEYGYYEVDSVTAWKPLIEPYKADKENKE